ncbi:MAG: hypothetical protein AAF542_17785 [Pseudomonadota bacterium]
MELEDELFDALMYVAMGEQTDRFIQDYSEEINDLAGSLAMIYQKDEGGRPAFHLTDKGECYMKALRRVKLPEQIWVVK